MVRAHSTAKLPTSPLMSSFDHARHTATQRANIHCLERTDLSTFRYTYELLLITGTWSVYLQALVNQLITGVSPVWRAGVDSNECTSGSIILNARSTSWTDNGT
jgi:hypothetical protein